jgi:hypothetical protein
MVDVFVNGVKFVNGTDFTATDGTTVALAAGLAAGNIVEIDNLLTAYLPTNALRTITTFTATAGQSAFSVSYTQGLIDVFYNGSCLAQSEYIAINGTSVTLVTACQVNDIVVVYAYSYSVGAYSGIGGSGTSGYHAKFTGSNTIGNSIVQDDGATLTINGTSQNVMNINSTNATGVYTTYKYNTSTSVGFIGNGVGVASGGLAGDFGLQSVNSLIFATNGGTTRMTITTAGLVGIGTTSPTGKLMLYQPTAGNVLQNIVSSQGGSTQVGINLSPSMTDGEVASNPAQASIYATDSNYGANIIFASKTTGAVGNALAERMRITSGGDVGIGIVPNDNSFRLVTKGINATSGNWALYCYNGSGVDLFGVRNDGAIYTGLTTNSPYNLTSPSAANCFINTNGFLYRSTSSLKYKKNVQDYTKGLAEVLQLRPVSYESINEEESGNIYAGLIAEEVNDLGLTEFVQYRTDGTPDALSYANMIALLTKAIQELSKELSTLKAIVATK